MLVKKRITLIFLLVVTIFALYLCYVILSPFLQPFIAAAVLAIVFFPAHAKVLAVIRRPGLAALVSTTLVTLIIIVPGLMIGVAITNEVTDLYKLIGEKSTESGGFSPFLMHLLERPLAWVGRYIDVSKIDLRATLLKGLQQISTFLLAEAGIVVSNITAFVIDAVIALFTLFFLFREGRSIRRRAAAILPLSNGQVDQLFSGIENTIIATVYGGLVVAAVQGALTGLALWALGIPSPVLWGVVAALFSLLPLVGSAAVWLPAAVYLLASGRWITALILIGWGAGVVGTVDNILRPYLMSGRVQMHTLLIFFAVFGGVSTFGFLGLFIGPVALAVTLTLFGMLRQEARRWQQYWRDDEEAERASSQDVAEEIKEIASPPESQST